MKDYKGLFITLEGGEGSGKSTTAKHLEKWLIEQGKDVLVTREPGGILSAENIRKNIMENDTLPLTEILLFSASRSECVQKVILPALETGKIVICDRYIDSSSVYQGIVNGLGLELIDQLNSLFIKPDLTLFFDINPEIGLTRIANNNREINKFDLKGLDFHNRVRAGYQQIANMEENINRIKTINAAKSENEVAFDCINILKEIL